MVATGLPGGSLLLLVTLLAHVHSALADRRDRAISKEETLQGTLSQTPSAVPNASTIHLTRAAAELYARALPALPPPLCDFPRHWLGRRCIPIEGDRRWGDACFRGADSPLPLHELARLADEGHALGYVRKHNCPFSYFCRERRWPDRDGDLHIDCMPTVVGGYSVIYLRRLQLQRQQATIYWTNTGMPEVTASREPDLDGASSSSSSDITQWTG